MRGSRGFWRAARNPILSDAGCAERYFSWMTDLVSVMNAMRKRNGGDRQEEDSMEDIGKDENSVDNMYRGVIYNIYRITIHLIVMYRIGMHRAESII